jgi:hypothetical protein
MTAAQKRQREAERAAAAAAAAQRARNMAATLKAGKSPFQPFKPYQPPKPTGYFDPALEAQRRAAGRGYRDTRQDTALAGTRAAVDLGFAYDDLNRRRSDYEAMTTAGTSGSSPRTTRTSRRTQDERANAYGVVPGGGAALQSAAKRATNQASDRAGLDLNRSAVPRRRRRSAQGQLDINVRPRCRPIRTTSLSRAGRENTLFGADIGAQEAWQAAQAGYFAPARGAKGGIPRNERVGAGGVHTRTQTFGGYVYTYDRTGRIVSKKRVK